MAHLKRSAPLSRPTERARADPASAEEAQARLRRPEQSPEASRARAPTLRAAHNFNHVLAPRAQQALKRPNLSARSLGRPISHRRRERSRRGRARGERRQGSSLKGPQAAGGESLFRSNGQPRALLPPHPREAKTPAFYSFTATGLETKLFTRGKPFSRRPQQPRSEGRGFLPILSGCKRQQRPFGHLRGPTGQRATQPLSPNALQPFSPSHGQRANGPHGQRATRTPLVRGSSSQPTRSWCSRQIP